MKMEMYGENSAQDEEYCEVVFLCWFGSLMGLGLETKDDDIEDREMHLYNVNFLPLARDNNSR